MGIIYEKIGGIVFALLMSLLVWRCQNQIFSGKHFTPKPPVFADWDTSNYIGDVNCRDFSDSINTGWWHCHSTHDFNFGSSEELLMRWRLNLESPMEMQFPDFIPIANQDWFKKAKAATPPCPECDPTWKPVDPTTALELGIRRMDKANLALKATLQKWKK